MCHHYTRVLFPGVAASCLCGTKLETRRRCFWLSKNPCLLGSLHAPPLLCLLLARIKQCFKQGKGTFEGLKSLVCQHVSLPLDMLWLDQWTQQQLGWQSWGRMAYTFPTLCLICPLHPPSLPPLGTNVPVDPYSLQSNSSCASSACLTDSGNQRGRGIGFAGIHSDY